MGLSPDEEDVFTAIVAGLRGPARIPWWIVGVSVVVVGPVLVPAVILGFPLHLALAFSLSFVIGLAAGLTLIRLSDRRARRL